MWAGAIDTRFAMIIDICSGEGGSALSRRNYGETIAHLVEPSRFPYWFCPNYQKYGDQVDELATVRDPDIEVARREPIVRHIQRDDVSGRDLSVRGPGALSLGIVLCSVRRPLRGTSGDLCVNRRTVQAEPKIHIRGRTDRCH